MELLSFSGPAPNRTPGAKPPASHGRSPRLGVLSPRGERMWPRIRCPFSRDYIFMRGQTRIPVFFRSGLRATFFLHTKKEGKDVPRGPRQLIDFLLGKSAGRRTPESAYTKRDCDPRAWGCCVFSAPSPTGPRGPEAPFLYRRRFRRLLPTDFYN